MANIDAAFGFVPIRHGSGGIIRLNEYDIDGGLAANIYEGAPVKSVGDGTITVAAAADTLLGIFSGVRYRDVTGAYIYSNKWVSGTATLDDEPAKALVYDDPNTHFMVQAHANFVAADIGDQADIVVPGTSGNTATGKSLVSLDDVGQAGIKIIRSLKVPGRSDAGHGYSVVGAYALVEVKINEHELGGATSTVSV
jgi:hypothetical protein